MSRDLNANFKLVEHLSQTHKSPVLNGCSSDLLLHFHKVGGLTRDKLKQNGQNQNC